MMRASFLLTALATAVFTGSLLPAAPAFLAPPNGTVGHNLQAFASIEMTEPAPPAGLDITITSDNPAQLLVSAMPNQPGSASIVLKVPSHHAHTPDFYLQAIGNPGEATYTVGAPGFPSAKGSVVIAPSAILMSGPSNSEEFRTTSRTSHKIKLYAAVLDAAGNAVDQQPIAAGLKVKVDITTSNAAVGAASPSSLVLSGGETTAMSEFIPAAPGNTLLVAVEPSGFATPAKFHSIAVTVNTPSLALSGEFYVGKDLQVMGYVLLGEPAPAGGIDVELTSEDDHRLILSPSEDEMGSKTLKLHIPAGEGKVSYYLQSLSDSGIVNYSAVAKGYNSKPTRIGLAPSGILVVFAPYGPPDEGEVLQPMAHPNPLPFSASLSDHKQLWMTFWPAYLDPATHRGADITAERLRPGVTVHVDVKNSNPAIAQIASSVTLSSKLACGFAQFVPLKTGETVVSIDTPPGFATPANATSVTATVNP